MVKPTSGDTMAPSSFVVLLNLSELQTSQRTVHKNHPGSRQIADSDWVLGRAQCCNLSSQVTRVLLVQRWRWRGRL